MGYSAESGVRSVDKQPIYAGNLVIYRGRVMLPVRGGEIDQPPAQGDPAQPEQGQGEGLGLYDLSAAPPEIRPFIEQEMKKVEANVTRKFQEAADFRKKWEPYEGIDGLGDLEPEDLSRLLQFHSEVLSDPDAFENWYRAVGEEMGIAAEPQGREEEGGEGEDFTDPALEAAIERVLQTVDERLKPFEETLTEQQQEQRITEAQEEIRGELDALKEEYGEFNEDLVCQLALAYDGSPDAIQKAFADYQRFQGQTESNAFESKDEAPDAALSGGTPATQVEPITDFKTAKDRSRERFAATRS